MPNHAVRTVFLGIISSLITAIIIPAITIILGLSLNISLESRLIVFNMALILAVIFLILNQRFSTRQFRLIRPHEHHEVYLVERNIARHIPDEFTFNYLGQLYGFAWKDIDMVTNDEIKKQYSSGSTLPSVLPYCQQFHEQKKKNEKNE